MPALCDGRWIRCGRDPPVGRRKRGTNSPSSRPRFPVPTCAWLPRKQHFCATCSCGCPSFAKAWPPSKRRREKKPSRLLTFFAWNRPPSSRRRRTWRSPSIPSPWQPSARVPGTGLAPSRSAARARRRWRWPMAAKYVCRPARNSHSPAAHRRCRLCPRALCRLTSTTISRQIWFSPAPVACACSAKTLPAGSPT